LYAQPKKNLPVEPEFDTAQFDAELATIPVPEKKPSLDPLIDVLTAIDLDSPLSGDAILAAMPATRRVGSKPFAVEGLREDGLEDEHEDGLVWEVPRPGRRYTSLQAGVQLANRTGALNDIEYSEFVIKAQAFADAIGGEPEFPEMHDEVARARELDAFAAAHDAQLRFVSRCWCGLEYRVCCSKRSSHRFCSWRFARSYGVAQSRRKLAAVDHFDI
jgi:hypothetical protein